MRAVAMLGIALSATACAMNGPPVLVAGAPDDLQLLTGEWDGEYVSAEAGRTGRPRRKEPGGWNDASSADR